MRILFETWPCPAHYAKRPALKHSQSVQGTLVGLLAAFSYELSILHTASRLTSADAFRTLHALYRERTHPVAMSSGGLASSSTMEGEWPDYAFCSRNIRISVWSS